MYEYLDATKVAGQPFVILDTPTQVFRTSMEYRNDGISEEMNLPKMMTCYLVDESLAPYSKIKDLDGNEINNLITFQIEGKNCRVLINGEETEATNLEYNFFNYPSPVTVKNIDGTESVVRKKYLDCKYRANVFFPKAINAKVWDKKDRAEKTKSITHAKLDLPRGLYSKAILDQLETVRETLGEDLSKAPDFPSFLYSFEFDGSAAPPDKYRKVKVKKNKEKLDATKQLEAFIREEREPFVPPATPF